MTPTPEKRDELTAQLIAARKSAGVAVAAIATRANVGRRSIYDVENQITAPSQKILLAYAGECKLPADELLLDWGKVPFDVLNILRTNPDLCQKLRLETRAELAREGG